MSEENNKILSIALPEGLVETIDAMAKSQQRTRAGQIRYLLDKVVQSDPEADEPKEEINV